MHAFICISIPVGYVPEPIPRELLGDAADDADITHYGRWQRPTAQWEYRSLDVIGSGTRKRTREEIRKDLAEDLKNLYSHEMS